MKESKTCFLLPFALSPDTKGIPVALEEKFLATKNTQTDIFLHVCFLCYISHYTAKIKCRHGHIEYMCTTFSGLL